MTSFETGMSAYAEKFREEMERNAQRFVNSVRLLGQRPAVGATPKDTVWSDGKAQLWRYRSDHVAHRTPVMIVMSLVSRSYILDLLPGNSFVEALRDQGFDVFLLDWGVPGAAESGNRLEDYVQGWIPAALRAVCEVSGSAEVSVLGYCLGGTLAGMAAAADRELPIASLVMVAAPVNFADVGTWSDVFVAGLEPELLLDLTGNVPPLLIENYFRMLKPAAEATQANALMKNLAREDFVRNFQAMNLWIHDHVPFPGTAFGQVVELLLKQNRLMHGGVTLDGTVVDIGAISCPLLNVIADKDHLVPVGSAAPWSTLTASEDAGELRLSTGHVGLIAGRGAARTTQPQVAAWLAQRTEGCPT